MRTRHRRPDRTAAERRPGPGDGPPIVLPRPFDQLSDRWWGLSPRRRAAVAAVVAVGAFVGIGAASVGDRETAPTTVLVADEDLATGTVLAPEHVRAESRPADQVPERAADEATGTLRTSLPAGAVLTTGHVTDDGLGSVVGPGRAAVPVPAELLPDLPVGSALQLVGPAADGAAATLSDDAAVVAVDGESVWLDVAAGDAAEVVAGSLRGTLGIAVLPPRPGDATP